MLTWSAAPPSGPLATTSQVLDWFVHVPGLGAGVALTVLCAELFWIKSLGWVWARRVLHPLAALLHLGIFLDSGISFKIWPLTAFLLLVPWRRRFGSDTASQFARATQPSWLSRDKPFAPFVVVGLIVVLPVIAGRTTFPLAKYDSFGWSYTTATREASFYAFATIGPAGDPIVVDHNYFGFLDFVGPGRVSAIMRPVAEAESEPSEYTASVVCSTAASVSAHRSNEWLLGPLALPAHVWYQTDEVTAVSASELIIVELHWADPAESTEPEVRVVSDLGFCEFT